MKKLTSSVAVAAFIGLGLAAGAAVPASAADDVCVASPAHTVVTETPATGELTIEIRNPEYVPPTPGTPGTPAIGEPTIEIDNPSYIPEVPGTPGSPAIGEPTIEVENPDYVPESTVPGYWQVTPAVGEPTIEIPNPDYVPGTPGTPGSPAVGTPTIIVANPDYIPAVPDRVEVVHHEAVTHVEYHFTKFTQERTREKGSRGGWGAWSGYGDWVEWSPETHTSWQRSTDPLGAPQFHSSGNYGPNKQWEKQWQARYDGTQRTVEDKAAWDEEVLIPGSPAVGTETIEITNPSYVPEVPATPEIPAQGEPTITIENPDYVPESKVWIEPVTTPAVGEPTVTIENPGYIPATPGTEGTPAVGEPTIVVENPNYVPGTPAIPGTPAVGEPTIVILNPDYIPATSTVTEVPAVVCDVPEEPKAPEVTPAVKVTKGAAASSEDTLAQTGGEPAFVALAAAGALIVAGSAVVVGGRIRRARQQ